MRSGTSRHRPQAAGPIALLLTLFLLLACMTAQAKAAKMPVIPSDRTLVLKPENQSKGLHVISIGTAFRCEGRAAAAWLGQETAGHCNSVGIQGRPDSSPSIAHGKGVREVMMRFPAMKIIATQAGMWRTDPAREVMRAHLKAEGRNICAVFAHNDNMAFGMVSVPGGENHACHVSGDSGAMPDVDVSNIDLRHGLYSGSPAPMTVKNRVASR